MLTKVTYIAKVRTHVANVTHGANVTLGGI